MASTGSQELWEELGLTSTFSAESQAYLSKWITHIYTPPPENKKVWIVLQYLIILQKCNVRKNVHLNWVWRNIKLCSRLTVVLVKQDFFLRITSQYNDKVWCPESVATEKGWSCRQHCVFWEGKSWNTITKTNMSTMWFPIHSLHVPETWF